MNVEFSVRAWGAWAPGLTQAQDWLTWSQQPCAPIGDEVPALAQIAPMARRRLEPLGRMAMQAVLSCAGADTPCPVVFASRHGDAARTQVLLNALAAGEPLSPTAFGLSVHNAIAGQYSILRQDHSNLLAIAAGAASPEAALIEAAGLLAEGADQVLVVVYDTVLPPVFERYRDEPHASFAWAWRVTARDGSTPHYSLTRSGEGARITDAGEPLLPHALEVLHFLLAGRSALDHVADGGTWQWRRHA